MQGKKKTCIWRAEGGKSMRRTKRFASFALAACMGVSLLVNVPAGTVSAAEPEKTVTSPVEGMTEEAVPGATGTDAEALDETQEVVYEADANGFVWDGTRIVVMLVRVVM